MTRLGRLSSVEIGTRNQSELAGAPVAAPLFEFAPAVDQFLKGHLFGDIFGRDNLDCQSREIARFAEKSVLRRHRSSLLEYCP